MNKPTIIKYYEAFENQLDFEYDTEGPRPAWIHVKDPDFKARFLSVRTDTDSEVIYKRFTGNYYYPINFSIDKNEEERFYKKYAQFYDVNTSKNNLPMAQFLLDEILRLKIPKSVAILDIGSGTGIFSDLAAANGFSNLTLLDIYQAMLDVAKSKPNLTNANFINADITKVELPDKYDIVASVMMFDAIEDKKLPQVLEKLKNSMNIGGYLLIIEDKKREQYGNVFETLKEGITQFSDNNSLTKYFFIGKRT